MLVDELRELTNNSKQYQEEYEGIVRKLREIALGGLNEMKVIGGISNAVKDRLRKEGLTVIHKYESAFGQPISYDIIKW